MNVVLLLAACDGPRAPREDTGVDVTPAGTEAPAPIWTAEDVGAAIDAAFALGVPEPWTVHDLFIDLMDQGDGNCPGPDYQMAMPNFSCEHDGYVFYGVATFSEDSTEELESWEMLLASLVITDPQGNIFEAGGSFAYIEGEAGDWSGWVEGIFNYAPADGWLAEEPSSAIEYVGTRGDSSTATLHGGITAGDSTLWFEEVGTDNGACAGAFAGVLRVRAPDGWWYVVDFGESCGTCGQVSYEGSDLGEACIDVTGPMDTFFSLLEAR